MPSVSQGQERVDRPSPALAVATLELALGEEAETFRWMQTEVRSQGSVPLLEAEAVVRSLSVAMHGDSRMVLPLLKLKEFDQYTTTHSLNVAVLSMGLAESLGLPAAGDPRDRRRRPAARHRQDPDPARSAHQARQAHRRRARDHELSIRSMAPGSSCRATRTWAWRPTVAYEHHIMLNGGGYPPLHYNRECTMASRLVHVCDVYDALSTKRPYRDAWPSEKTMAYLEERAGTEFDPDLVAGVHSHAAAGSGAGARAERRASRIVAHECSMIVSAARSARA